MDNHNVSNSDIKNEISQRSHQTKNASFARVAGSGNVEYDSFNIDLSTCKISAFSSGNVAFQKHHKESIGMAGLPEETYMRPPLWEDITSSIQNIDPENAVMLGGVAATQVKLETIDAEKYLENLPNASQLSTLEVKPELKHFSSQVYTSITAHSQSHTTPKLSNTMFLNGANSNTSIGLDR